MTPSIASRLSVPTFEFGPKSFLVRGTDSERVLADCRRFTFFILGIEVFRSTADGIIPDMDMIADFSELTALPLLSRSSASIEAAERFLRLASVPPDSFLDIEICEIA